MKSSLLRAFRARGIRWIGCILALMLPILPLRAEVGTQLVVPVADNGQIFNGIVTALAQNRQGFIWIGTQYGLLRYDGYHYRRFAVRGPDNGSISGVFVRRLWLAPDGRLWVGTNSDGAAVFDPATERFTLFLPVPGDPTALSSGRVDAFAADGHGGVWIGSNDGLYHWTEGARTLEREGTQNSRADAPSDPHVRSLLLDAHKTLWVGTWDGLSRLRDGARHFERAGATAADRQRLARQEIWALIQDRDGRIWWGGRTLGAGWIDPASGAVHALPLGAPGGLDSPWVSGFALDPGGALWIATYSGGVDVVDPGTAQVVRRFQHHDGVDSTLASNVIGAILCDRSGLMWIGNWGAGLQRVNTGNHAFRMLRHVPGNPRSLSMENVYALLQVDDGRVWVGTDGNGIDILDLSRGVVGGIRPDPGNRPACRRPCHRAGAVGRRHDLGRHAPGRTAQLRSRQQALQALAHPAGQQRQPADPAPAGRAGWTPVDRHQRRAVRTGPAHRKHAGIRHARTSRRALRRVHHPDGADP